MIFVHVDFKGLVFLVFSISAGSYTFPDFFLMEFAESWGEVFSGDIPFRAEYSKDCQSLISGYGSLNAVEGSFSEDDWSRQWPTRIVESIYFSFL